MRVCRVRQYCMPNIRGLRSSAAMQMEALIASQQRPMAHHFCPALAATCGEAGPKPYCSPSSVLLAPYMSNW